MKKSQSMTSLRTCATALLLCCALPAHAQNTVSAGKFRGFVDQYCAGCHNQDDYAGGLDLASTLKEDITLHTENWEKVVRKLRAGMMPPPGEDRPVRDSYEQTTRWLEDEIDRHAKSSPGAVTLHRLNRSEYANAIRDLLDLNIDPTILLPPDTLAHGFDNMAGSLTISSTLLEAFTTAAMKVSSMALGYLSSPTEVTYLPPGDTSQNQHLEGLPMGTRGGMLVEHTFPADGDYSFIVQNLRVGTFIPGQQLELSIDGKREHVFAYSNLGRGRVEGGEGDLKITLPVKSGSHKVGMTFEATHYRPSFGTLKQFDRKSLENEILPGMQNEPVIGMLKIQGPFNGKRPQDSPSMRKVFTCHPTKVEEETACATEILGKLAKAAWRHPLTDQDMQILLGYYRQARINGTFVEGIEQGLARVLASPQFLVRTEQEPPALPAGSNYRISDIELASRLSFFLWSSIPDKELLDLAEAGKLSKPAVLATQVKRMLADPRSQSLVNNFASQWFYLRNLPATFPDGIYYPNWDDELRQGFRRETELLFENVMREDRPVTELLDADYTFVNERLAKHYGIPHIYGSYFRRVSLGPELDYRRGLLGQGSFLSITFTQNFRTSPVKRGVWVLENILGTPPPSPPANVPALEDTNGGDAVKSLRNQMELHRANPTCATCHRLMDGIGFSLENFDADGKWRTQEGHPRKWGGVASPINTSVTLWDGTEVNDPAGLRAALLHYSPQFVRFATEKLMTYALGRGVEYYDMPVIRRIVNNAGKDDYRFSALVLGIVNSDPFLLRTQGSEQEAQ
ncbi:MAG: DUF1592 domain-containing protein [Gammaproteobacteria bacterium]